MGKRLHEASRGPSRSHPLATWFALGAVLLRMVPEEPNGPFSRVCPCSIPGPRLSAACNPLAAGVRPQDELHRGGLLEGMCHPASSLPRAGQSEGNVNHHTATCSVTCPALVCFPSPSHFPTSLLLFLEITQVLAAGSASGGPQLTNPVHSSS